MRSFKYLLGIIVLSSILFSACKENISDPQPSKTGQKSLSKQMDKFQRIAKVMNENNLEGHAYFIEPQSGGYGIGLLKNVEIECFDDGNGGIYCNILSGQIAFFSGTFGTGDYWRQNPDGTVSVKLTTEQASALYADMTSGELYLGTGHMNSKFTGHLEEYCFEDQGITYCYSFLVEDPGINAWVLHGHSNVTLNGEGGETHTVDMHLVQNPGQQGQFDFTFN
jgi:hypothetical protein